MVRVIQVNNNLKERKHWLYIFNVMYLKMSIDMLNAKIHSILIFRWLGLKIISTHCILVEVWVQGYKPKARIGVLLANNVGDI